MAPRNIALSRIIRCLTGLAVIAAAAVIFAVLYRTHPSPKSSDRAQRARRVVVLEAQAVPVRRQWRGFGTALAMDSADVPARVSTTVAEVPEGVLAGAGVAKGQVLVRLDESDFARDVEIATESVAIIEAQLAQLEVQQRSLGERRAIEQEDLALAHAELQRVKGMFEQNATNQQDIDRVQRVVLAVRRTVALTEEAIDQIAPRRQRLEANRSAQISGLHLARQNLRRCAVVSPLAGVLQTVNVEVGESVVTGKSVARVVSLSRIEVLLRLPAAARSTIDVGDAVVLESTNNIATNWSSQVARIAPEDDQNTRTLAVYVELANGHGSHFAPGQFVAGAVTCGRTEQRFVVPRRSFQGSRVFLVENQRIVSREVQVEYLVEQTFARFALPDMHWAVLRSPLPDGSLVVVNASSFLVDGEVVHAILPSESTVLRPER